MHGTPRVQRSAFLLGNDIACDRSPELQPAIVVVAIVNPAVEPRHCLLFGDPSQFIAQLLSAVVVAVFGFVMAYVWFKISDAITPIRVSAEIENEGLDAAEVGVLAYPDFALHQSKRIYE